MPIMVHMCKKYKILDSPSTIHVTSHIEYFSTCDEDCRNIKLGNNEYSCHIVDVDDMCLFFIFSSKKTLLRIS